MELPTIMQLNALATLHGDDMCRNIALFASACLAGKFALTDSSTVEVPKEFELFDGTKSGKKENVLILIQCIWDEFSHAPELPDGENMIKQRKSVIQEFDQLCGLLIA